MKRNTHSTFRRTLREEKGQTLVWAVLLMVLFLGMSGLIIDIGHAYFCYRLLQASSDAAALAGAEALPNSTAVTQATNYSAVSGGANVFGNLPGVAMVSGYPKLECLTTLVNQGEACVAPASANAIQVKQTASVPTYFIRALAVFGINSAKTVTITATSTAAMRGAVTSPYNVAIVLDTTASMTTSDSDCGGISRIDCALGGVQTLLGELDPCASSYATCSVSNGVATNSVDRVSVFTFPNMTLGTAPDEYGCNSNSISVQPYTFPSSTATTYSPSGSSTPTYQVTGFLSDYRASDTSKSLNTSSNISTAIGSGSSGSSCEMDAKGGAGTYYAGAIYAAQASLYAEQLANTGSQNVMIILSDGEAQSTNMASKDVNGNTVSTSSGIYPSTVDQCQQAIMAANYATAQGTRVYTVAYGSEDSGCNSSSGGTDSKVVLTGSGYSGVTLAQITPCFTMEKMASSTQYFFSDYNQSGSGSTCQSASQPTTNIKQIFAEIGNDFTLPRLIPDATT
jgi:Flp pilus assembly protein TadG